MGNKLKKVMAFLLATVMTFIFSFQGCIFENIGLVSTVSAEESATTDTVEETTEASSVENYSSEVTEESTEKTTTLTALEGTGGANSSEGYEAVVDGDESTKWCVIQFSSAYVVMKAEKASNITGYYIMTGNDTEKYPSRNPKSWVLYGCNDYTTKGTGTWKPIHTVTNDTFMQIKNSTKYYFGFDKTETPYQYYKLMITANTGSETCIQISEFDLLYCDHQWESIEAKDADCVNDGYTVYSCNVCGAKKQVAGDKALGHSFNDDGKCTRCGVSNVNPSKPANGDGSTTNPYKISTLGELLWFSGLVNGTLENVSSNLSACAVLTDNIVVNKNVLDADGNLNDGTYSSWEAISNRYYYYGTFDGNGKTISGLYINDTNNKYIGLFGSIGGSGKVTNLNIEDSYFKGSDKAGGVAKTNYGTIENVSVKAYIESDGNIGGIVGENNATIKNCFTDVKLSQRSYNKYACGIGYSEYNANIYSCLSKVSFASKVSNNNYGVSNRSFNDSYYVIDKNTVNNTFELAGKEATISELQSGKLTYLLNNSLSDDTVVWRQDLSDKNSTPVPNSGCSSIVYYQYYNTCVPIYSNNSTAGEQVSHNYENGVCVNGCNEPEINSDDVYLIYNIEQFRYFLDLCRECSSTNLVNCKLMNDIDVSGDENWITIGDRTNGRYYGTFDGNGHTIKGINCVRKYSGLIRYNHGTIQNLSVEGYFEGSSYVGPITAYNYGEIKNCYADATLKGVSDNTNVLGIAYNSSSKYIRNSLAYITIAEGSIGKHCGISNSYVDNSYYVVKSNTDKVLLNSYSNKEYNAEDITSGKVTYLLNSKVSDDNVVWRQELGTENSRPVPNSTGSIVYYLYDNTCVPVYTNNANSTEIAHQYENGICKNGCNMPENVNKIYQIYTEKQFLKFAELCEESSSSKNVNAKLMADISLKDIENWKPIGNSSSVYYYGTFDGNYHTISDINCVNRSRVGLFGDNYGTIKNLNINGYFEDANRIGGIAESNDGRIENCYAKVTLKGTETSTTVNGICYNFSSGKTNNCLAVITIPDGANGDYKGISNLYMTNCGYEIASNESTVQISATSATEFNAERLASGEAAYILNNKSTEDSVCWRQNIGTDSMPVLDITKSIVYAKYKNSCIPIYVNDSDMTGYSDTPVHNYENGICTNGCNIPEKVDNEYLIYNEAQLLKFAELCFASDKNSPVNCKIMSDLDLTEITNWVPLKDNKGEYYGIFDGNNHTIALKCNNSKASLFSNNNGTIKNLVIKGEFESTSYVTPISCTNNGKIENCYVDVSIKGTSSNANLYGICFNSSGKVSNCLAVVTIQSDSLGTYYGIANSNEINNYYNIKSNESSVTVKSSNSTLVTDEELASGKIAYLLNRKKTDSSVIWRQTIGTDIAPVLDSSNAIVYAKYKDSCMPVYTNDNNLEGYGDTPIHNYVDGVCTNGCGELEQESDTYHIYSLEQFNQFVEKCKSASEDNPVNGMLMNDISLESVSNWTPIAGVGGMYYGTFDGNGHTISDIKCNNSYAGLFKNNYGTIKNLAVKGKFEGYSEIGSITSLNYGLIENCYAEVTLNSTGNYTDVYAIGYNRSTIGYTGYINNCLAVITYESGKSNYYYPIGVTNVNNCYYKIASNTAGCTLKSDTSEEVTDEELASGKIALLLNKNVCDDTVAWRQNIGAENSIPTLDKSASLLYVKYKNNDCIPIYTNDSELTGCTDTPNHNYVDGICTNGCGEPIKEDDFYLIYSATQLQKFASIKTEIDKGVNARLMADIDMTGIDWKPMANYNNRFYGEFDGNGYTISNININVNGSYAGFIYNNYGTVKNLSIIATYTGEPSYVYGICMYNYGNIENDYVKMTVNTSNSPSCVCGMAYGNYSIINSCFADITSNNASVNGICSYNSYSDGKISRAYFTTQNSTGSYYGSKFSSDDVTSGKVTYLLNGSKKNGEMIWRQNLSDENSRPIPNHKGYIVMTSGNGYRNVGNINDDDVVDKADVALILKYISGSIDTLPNMESADYNGDKAINLIDVVSILES